jgi:hypothetical protein
MSPALDNFACCELRSVIFILHFENVIEADGFREICARDDQNEKSKGTAGCSLRIFDVENMNTFAR